MTAHLRSSRQVHLTMPSGMPAGIGLIAANEMSFGTQPCTAKCKVILPNRSIRKLLFGRIEDHLLLLNVSGNIKSP